MQWSWIYAVESDGQPELLVVLQLNAATLFSTATSRCRTLLSVRSFVYAAYILAWKPLLNPCSLVGRRYWAG